MLSKSSRYALIAAACLKLGTAQRVNAVLYPSRHDVAEETGLARERDRGELPTDEDLPTLASKLSFDNAPDSDNGGIHPFPLRTRATGSRLCPASRGNGAPLSCQLCAG